MTISNSSDQARSSLRNFIKKTRSSLSKDEILSSSISVSDFFIEWLEVFLETNKDYFNKPIKIGAYLSTGGEIDLSPIFDGLSTKKYSSKLSLYVPALHPILKGFLQFREYDVHLDNIKVPNAYGIFEPVFDSEKTIATWDLDVVLMPLVACDEKGCRLGMGGGYYDRSFAFLNNTYKNADDNKSMESSGPILIGVGYDFQKVQGLVSQKWDVDMDAFISPGKGLLFF